MSIEYPFKIVIHNNLVLIDLPKTPEKYVGKGLLFTASNGLEVWSMYTQSYFSDDDGILYIRGGDDNKQSNTMVINTPTLGYTMTAKQAEALKAKLQTALDEFVAWMGEQDKPVTRLDVFKELFPNAWLDENGIPKLHPCDFREPILGMCGEKPCPECRKAFWNEPAPEKFQKRGNKE